MRAKQTLVVPYNNLVFRDWYLGNYSTCLWTLFDSLIPLIPIPLLTHNRYRTDPAIGITTELDNLLINMDNAHLSLSVNADNNSSNGGCQDDDNGLINYEDGNDNGDIDGDDIDDGCSTWNDESDHDNIGCDNEDENKRYILRPLVVLNAR